MAKANQTVLHRSLLAAAVGAVLSCSPMAHAVGEVNGGVNGVVIANQAKLDGATVTLTHKQTGLTRTVTSDATGQFRINQLPIGDYTVTVEKDGYSSAPLNLTVSIGSGTSVVVEMQAAGAERVEVIGSRVSRFDMESTDSGLTISEVEFDRLPALRDINKVALLAPGVSEADNDFDGTPVFSGASAAENVYYINGMNLTDFRYGWGGSEVPFEFFKEFQVKTGGYSAEFGRSAGGVVNAVSKSGTNEWTAGANLYWSPKRWQKDSGDVYNADGDLVAYRSDDDVDDREMNIEVGGPLIKDKLFFYGLYNPRNVKKNNYEPGYYDRIENNDAFWGSKLDYHITDDQLLEYTAFSNKDTSDYTEYHFDVDSGMRSGAPRKFRTESGGLNQILRYTGIFAEVFTVSALWGRTEADLTSTSGALDAEPVINYSTDGANYIPLGDWVLTSPTTADDERTVKRLDFDWDIGDHTLSFGIDREELVSREDSDYSGHVLYYIDDYAAEDPDATSELWQQHKYVKGTYSSKSSAVYLEGTWRLGDVTLTTGLRNEYFENLNGKGGTFLEMKNNALSLDDLLLRSSDHQWAARYGVVWDIGGDGDDKLFANAGRYFLPVANILNIKLAGAYYRDRTIYEWDGQFDANGVPLPGAVIDDLTIQFDGQTADPRTIVNQDIKPMYQDEFILGYSRQLDNSWTAKISAIYRDLKRAIDDSTPCKALDAIAADRYGYDPDGEDSFCYSITPPYVLTNPGEGMDFWFDFGEGDGLERLQLSADSLGYPEAKRTYRGIDLTFDRAFDGVWELSASYTWSKTEGNYEGTVRSDYPNADGQAGFTTAFDFYSMLEHGYGYLPNDRRHKLKFSGSYVFAEDWQVGFNLSSVSGRPISYFGMHPSDPNNQYYIDLGNFYDEDGNPAPRGSRGRTSWVHVLDLSLQYSFTIASADADVRIDVGNVFNFDNETSVYELGDANYGAKWERQDPRTVMLSASVRF